MMDGKYETLRDFEAFLLNSGGIHDEKVKFFLHWVRRFLKFSNYQLENINTERISEYLDSLEADEKVKDWQLKQAADAVILYVEKYLNRSLQQATTLAGDSEEKSINIQGSIQWKQILEEAKNAIRLRHFSYSTEKTYLGWIGRFKTFLKERDPHSLEAEDLKKYLTHLALHGRVSSSTQNQAFNALLFLYRHILHKEVDELTSVARAKRRMNLPTVLSRDEVKPPRASARGILTASAKPAEAYLPTLKLLQVPFSHSSPSFRRGILRRRVRSLLFHLNGVYLLMAQLMYGCGLRLMAYLRNGAGNGCFLQKNCRWIHEAER